MAQFFMQGLHRVNWINCSDYSKVLSMLQYSDINIIVINESYYVSVCSIFKQKLFIYGNVLSNAYFI